MKTNHVWVVEIFNRGRFEPCTEAKLTKEAAECAMREWWKTNCPDDRFRVTKYTAAAPRGEGEK